MNPWKKSNLKLVGCGENFRMVLRCNFVGDARSSVPSVTVYLLSPNGTFDLQLPTFSLSILLG